jgi:hypothetical protein
VVECAIDTHTDIKVIMSTPDQYGQQPWPGPTGHPGSPPQYPPPAQPQYPPPAQPQYPPQYPPPAQPQYPPPPSQPTYGAPQYPPPSQPAYGAPEYPTQQQYPPQQQYPDQQGQFPPGAPPPPYTGLGEIPPAPPPQKRSPMKVIGSIGVTLLIVLGIIAVRIALRETAGSNGSSSSAAAPKTPFEGTPAATFPEGEAGIVLPPATELAGFTQEQVAAALESVKKAMIAARLDTTMLVKHDTSVLLGLIAPENQKSLEDLFAKKDFMHFATQIAPNYNLTADKIRVKGETTFSAKTEEDIRFIEVKTNYVWVYPFAGELKEPGDHLVTIHDEITWLFPAEADVDPEFRGMYIDSTQSYSSNIDCDLADQSLLALGKPRFVPGGATVDDDQVFDPNGSLDLGNTC